MHLDFVFQNVRENTKDRHIQQNSFLSFPFLVTTARQSSCSTPKFNILTIDLFCRSNLRPLSGFKRSRFITNVSVLTLQRLISFCLYIYHMRIIEIYHKILRFYGSQTFAKQRFPHKTFAVVGCRFTFNRKYI